MTRSLAEKAATDADAPAVRDETGSTSWAQLDERVNRLISVLRQAGQQGDRVAVHSGNRRECFEASRAVINSVGSEGDRIGG